MSMAGINALDAIEYNEGQLEALFRRCPTLAIDPLVNKGGQPGDRHGERRPSTTTATGRASSRRATC